MNGLKNFDNADREYSLDPADDLIGFWRSEVRSQGHSRPWRRHSSSSFYL